eukprot:TRINITY_DN1940_c0_g1_i1.p1 TRINITY_DN1940_c0_g1~~TRINITY_DN1940_c0_g1_i1.p1  ORF type:complete len:339 (-),score=37.96 TRINITY_DN1940_c0_g1_i1:7-1023(-)
MERVASPASLALYKYCSLAVLVVQNCSQMLLMRYSLTKGAPYLASTAVVVAEVMKLLCSLVLVYKEEGWNFNATVKILRDQIWNVPLDTLKVGIPAFLYTIQNNLLYVASTHLDAATMQVTYQLKILTTALFSVSMLGTRLNSSKWLALVFLVIGVALVQMPTSSAPVEIVEENSGQVPFFGLVAVLSACMLSGFAGVYFEKILKKTVVSVWVRNIQLGSFGALLSLLTAFAKDGDAIQENGFFQNYDYWTWTVITDVAVGGLVVAVVVKYADNISKGFATSLSVVMSTVISIMFLGFQLTETFTLGAAIVIAATILYSRDVKQGSPPIIPTFVSKQT